MKNFLSKQLMRLMIFGLKITELGLILFDKLNGTDSQLTIELNHKQTEHNIS